MNGNTHILNRILPMRVRSMLRWGALRTIPSMRHLSMPTRLKHLNKIGFHPATIVDVGAGHGDWARMAAKLWPTAKIIGFEPNVSEIASLEKTKHDLQSFDYISGFLGPTQQSIQYTDSGHQTSILSQINSDSTSEHAEMYILDELIQSGRLRQPDFIKLDVQGYELEVLRGAQTTLRHCQAVLTEVNFIRSHKAMPTADEVIDFMRSHGFRWYDVMGILRRLCDDALWQMDFFFLKESHPLLDTRA